MGVKVTAGDPFKGPNFFFKVVSGNSFEARDGRWRYATLRGGGLLLTLATAQHSHTKKLEVQ